MTSRFWASGGNGLTAFFPSGFDPSAGNALYLPYSVTSPTYRVGATTSSPTPAALPGYGPTRSGGKGEIEATDRAGSYGPEVLTNGEFTANVASWTATNLTATWTAGAALLTKTLDGSVFEQTIVGGLTGGRWRLVARLVVSERARIRDPGGAFANLDGASLWTTSTPGTFDIDLILTSLGGSGNITPSVDIADNAVWAANGATVSVEYIRLTKIASRIDYLGTNQPAIIPGVGYWSRVALTNLEVQSQTFDARTLTGATAVANNVVAPDGATTADTLTASAVTANAAVNLTIVASTLYTTSVFIPAGGTGLFAYIQINAGAAGASGSAFLTFNRSTGAISAVQTITAGIVGLTGYAVAVGGGWRFIATWTGPAAITNADTFVGLSETTATRTTVVGKTMPAWQGQTILGNHPTGGPIIVTGAATASIGADLFPLTVAKPAAAFVIYGKAVLSASKTSNSFLFYWGAADGSNVIRAYVEATSNLLVFNVVNASVATAITGESGTPATSRTVTFALRFNGSTWRAFVNGVALGAESAAAAIPPDASFKVASANASNQLDDRLTDLRVSEGNKTDGEVIALMAAL